jgi:fatty-acyl-CoA synthase
VTAVVSLVDGLAASDADDRPDAAALIAHAKEHLAGYKCPKRVVLVEAIQRGPNGKPDYRWAAEVATSSGSTGD